MILRAPATIVGNLLPWRHLSQNFRHLTSRPIGEIVPGMKPTSCFLACLATAITWAIGATPTHAAPLRVGDKAPLFSAAASDGSTVKLQDYAGKANVVLYFYPKDNTPGCTKQACGLRDDFPDFKGLDAVVFGVSFDSVESHRQFVQQHQLPFRLLADTDKSIARAYGAADETSRSAQRMTFIIGKDGKIAYINPKVNPATHSAEVRNALRALQHGTQSPPR